MTLAPVRLPGSSCPLMVENVAWDGYNRSAGQRTCSEPFGNAFRVGDPRGGSNMLFGNIKAESLFLIGSRSWLFGKGRRVICSEGSVDTPLTGVDTMLQTQGKIMQNWSSSVDTRSSSDDTRDSSQKTCCASMGQCVDTRSSSVDSRSGSVDTRGLPRTPFELIWDSVLTLDQISGLMQSEVEEDHVFPSRSPLLQRSNLAAHDSNLSMHTI
ncbi:hypothetical protein Taro_004945 [Colocasia esculenta]|uniref:Uncharacterized protein n=1 Tax=Colocasia esculenta TaxID=4460 RepID=A0A843TT19_COLES|nr:hypothetical protein [Colocasia esculenta]